MAIDSSGARQTAELPGKWFMTGSSNNTGRMRWLTFFAAGHAKGGKGGEGGVYPFYRLYHLSIDRFGENVTVIRRASDFDYHKQIEKK